jgi:hypothetical protein
MQWPKSVTVELEARAKLNQERSCVDFSIASTIGDDLNRIAAAYGCDKYGPHRYTPRYMAHLGYLRESPINLLEIGIGGYHDPRQGGASLRMWRAYFRNAMIHGVDIHDKHYHDEARIQTHVGSQDDADFLRGLVDQIGTPDVIIDGGSHRSADIITTFGILFPLLKSDGWYCIEDLQTSYWTDVNGIQWGGSPDRHNGHTSMNFLKSLTDGLNHCEFNDPDYVPSYHDRHIVEMHFYHNICFIRKGQNDQKSCVLQ